MRKIDCETCPTRGDRVCDLQLETLQDLREVGVTTAYRPRQLVFGEGNTAGGLYLVCQGRVKIYQSDRFGRERVLQIAGPGSIVGELGLGGEGGFSASAEAIEESQICFIAHADLEPLLAEHPDVGLRLIESLSQELGAARRRVRDVLFKDAGTRLAGLVVDLVEEEEDRAEQGEQRARFPYSRAELAQRVGVSTETAIRLLRKLSNKGLVEVDGRTVVVPDLDRLRRVARADELEA